MAYVYKQRKSKYYWCKIYDGEGNYKQESTKETNKKLAKHVASEKEKKFINGDLDLPKKVKGKNLEEAVHSFLERIKLTQSKRHCKNQRSLYKKSLLPFFGALTNVKFIDEERILDYLDSRLRAGIAPSTHNRELACIRSFLKHCKQKGWIFKFPITEIKQLKEVQKRRDHYRPEEVEEILKINHPKVIFHWLCFHTGCRPTEAINIKWAHIDFDQNQIVIESTEEKVTKTKDFRIIPLHKELKVQLLKTPQHISCPYVLHTKFGTKYGDESYKDFDKEIVRLAGVKYKGGSGLRHSFGTLYANSGFPLNILQRLMGHKRIETTMRYINTIDDNDRALMHEFSSKFIIQNSTQKVTAEV